MMPSPMSSPISSLYRQLFTLLVIASATVAILLAVRLLLVEPDEVAATCAVQVAAFSCKIRNAAIYGFAHHLFGPISIIAAVLAWIGALRIFALIAVMTGIAGMVLYDFDMAGVGMLLGVVLYVHLCLQRMKLSHARQPAPGQ